ncbi:TetR family transcriptional regulator [Desulfosarcina alkanivorans]|jgi:AcrR family transcriptional regulator|uniref:TetR family transcriptional regulator n=1 Tax=Desulfosarcina alkanivorans TaxID=571177 RepID=A0A5K7YNZ5_9BACT|nr:TetR/AcrR family transcriptional regulator [Desulfosarcina alkanivorans]BBO70035.1 TetR family transcriptional regulator [Desulfosarcina alkanivorans]
MKPAATPRAQKTRQFIIETAAPIFNKKGYAGTSMSDLTEATGLTKGSIYGNFKDKNDVAVNAFQHNLDLIFDFFTKELETAGSTLDKLLAYPRGFRKIYPMILAYGGCPILNTGVEADDTHAVLRRMAVDVLARWKRSIVVLIDKGMEQGCIDPSTDAPSTAEILISLMEGGSVLSKVTGEASYMHNAVDTAERMIEAMRRIPQNDNIPNGI